MLKNKAVVAIIIMILVGAIVYNIHFFYKRMHPAPTQQATSKSSKAPQPAKMAAPPSLSPGGKEKSETLHEKPPFPLPKRMLRASKWGRNPFFSLKELKQIALLKGEATENDKKKKAEQIPVILSGIIEVESERMAIINDRVMMEGEEINGIKLLKVMPEAVWVTVANLRRWVPLPQSRVTLVVQESAAKIAQKVIKEKGK